MLMPEKDVELIDRVKSELDARLSLLRDQIKICSSTSCSQWACRVVHCIWHLIFGCT